MVYPCALIPLFRFLFGPVRLRLDAFPTTRSWKELIVRCNFTCDFSCLLSTWGETEGGTRGAGTFWLGYVRRAGEGRAVGYTSRQDGLSVLHMRRGRVVYLGKGRVRKHVRCYSCGYCDRRGGQIVDDRYSGPCLKILPPPRWSRISASALCSGSVHSNPSSILYFFPSSRPSNSIHPRRLLIGLSDYRALSSLAPSTSPDLCDLLNLHTVVRRVFTSFQSFLGPNFSSFCHLFGREVHEKQMQPPRPAAWDSGEVGWRRLYKPPPERRWSDIAWDDVTGVIVSIPPCPRPPRGHRAVYSLILSLILLSCFVFYLDAVFVHNGEHRRPSQRQRNGDVRRSVRREMRGCKSEGLTRNMPARPDT